MTYFFTTSSLADCLSRHLLRLKQSKFGARLANNMVGQATRKPMLPAIYSPCSLSSGSSRIRPVLKCSDLFQVADVRLCVSARKISAGICEIGSRIPSFLRLHFCLLISGYALVCVSRRVPPVLTMPLVLAREVIAYLPYVRSVNQIENLMCLTTTQYMLYTIADFEERAFRPLCCV